MLQFCPSFKEVSFSKFYRVYAQPLLRLTYLSETAYSSLTEELAICADREGNRLLLVICKPSYSAISV
eukprot:2973678-Pyramimonas_sp.AAC.1